LYVLPREARKSKLNTQMSALVENASKPDIWSWQSAAAQKSAGLAQSASFLARAC